MNPDSFAFDPRLRDHLAGHLAAFERRRKTEADRALKRAAVAIAIVPGDRPGEAAFLLTRRAPRLRAHGGQWALPGGRRDPGETVERAALRELSEEVGLEAGEADIVGRLDDYPTRSGYLIAPVVVWAPQGARVVANPAEVASVHRIGFGELFRPGMPEVVPIPESDRPIIRMRLSVETVNSPTAALIYQFREVALAGRSTRVDYFDQPVFAWR